MSELTPQPLNSSKWEDAKSIIDRFEYGNEISRKTLPQATHKEGTKTHNVDNYEVSFNDVLGFEFKGFYVFCRTCNETRQKRLVLFHDKEGKVFVKDVIKDGHVTNE